MFSIRNFLQTIYKKALVLGSGAFFLLACFTLTFCQKSEKQAENDTEAAQTETDGFTFANHNPQVQYTGKGSCLKCHQDIHETFAHTGKGRSFHAPSRNNIIEDFSKAVVYDTYTDLGYRAFWRGDKMFIAEFRTESRDTIHYREEEVDYVIGSGNQTRSYLYQHKGYFYEMPLTWYVHKKIWDLSPGYEKGSNTGFRRAIGQQCMNCHNSDFEFEQFSLNKFKTVGDGMSCEKCHGPGEAHIKAMEAGQVAAKGEIDRTIVNPAKLPIQLQFDVCRQCHLEGITVPKAGKDPMDFRPGMALASFWDVFLPVSEDQSQFGFASHAERLQQSPCFINSGKTLTCNTCHDPHKPLDKTAALFYTEKCQSCHAPATFEKDHKSLKIADKNCINCHMPKSGTTDIPHVSSTDHFIRVVKAGEEKAEKAIPENRLVTFKSFTRDEETGENDREYVLANMIYFEQHGQDIAYLDRVKKHLDKLDFDHKIKYAYLRGTAPETSLAGVQPGSVSNPYTAYYISQILKRSQQPYLHWAERAVNLAPANLDFMYTLAQAHDDSGRETEAIHWYQKVLDLQPYYKEALVNLGYIYMLKGQFDKAQSLTEKAIKADPDYQLAHENQLNIYLQKGDFKTGLKLLDRLIRKYPDNKNYKDLRAKVQEML